MNTNNIPILAHAIQSAGHMPVGKEAGTAIAQRLVDMCSRGEANCIEIYPLLDMLSVIKDDFRNAGGKQLIRTMIETAGTAGKLEIEGVGSFSLSTTAGKTDFHGDEGLADLERRITALQTKMDLMVAAEQKVMDELRLKVINRQAMLKTLAGEVKETIELMDGTTKEITLKPAISTGTPNFTFKGVK